MTIEKTIDLFMDYCVSKCLRPHSMQAYEQTIKLFAAWARREMGITSVEEINEMVVRSYIKDLQTRGKYTISASKESEKYNHPQNRRDFRKQITNITINNYIRNMRVYFNWLVDCEVLSKSPIKKVREIPNERQPKEYMNDNEVKALFEKMDKGYFPEYRDLLVMMLMLDSGTRLGETLSIELEQLDLANRSITLPADKTKGRKERTVYFSSRTANELRRWLQFKDRYCDSDLIFPVKHTGAILKVTHFEANFRRYLSRIGIEKHISPHTFRNNFAKRCLLAGMDIYTLSRLLGHSSVKVTEKAYLDVSDKDLKRQYVKFSPLDKIFR